MLIADHRALSLCLQLLATFIAGLIFEQKAVIDHSLSVLSVRHF